MNFLAHLYLSGNSPDLMLGNFMADFIRGNQFHHLPPDIKKGIELHRAIDTFTDTHKIVHKGVVRLRYGYKKYSGVVVDIFYDHFLASLWGEYHKDSLYVFTRKIYFLLVQNYRILPAKLKNALPYIIVNDRLKSYERISGIKNALSVMSNYTSLPKETDFAIKILKEYYQEFKAEFEVFFKDLMVYVSHNYEVSFPFFENK